MRPTGPVDLGQATDEAKARMATRARKVLLVFAIAVGAALLLFVLAILVMALAFEKPTMVS